MAVRPGFIPIGETGEFLDSVQVDTPAGADLHRETVVFADAENPAGLAKVTNAPPAEDAYGAVVRVAGPVTANQGASPYAVTQSGSWTVAVSNFPATQAVSGTVTANLGTLNGAATAAKQLPDNHQVSVSNFPTTQAISAASLPLPSGAATAADQTTGNASLISIDGKMPDISGAWSYDAGVSGTLTVSAGRRILQISATAGDTAATMTINGGSTISIPAGRSLTIEPKGNLTAPTIVFTGTTAYFVEEVN